MKVTLCTTYGRPLRWGAALLLALALGCSSSADDTLKQDRELRDAAIDALAGRQGTIIVMDVRDGRIRAIADEETAVGWAFHPGSLVKLVTAWKGIEEGAIDPAARFACRGAATFSGTEYRCWFPPGHGDLDLVRGIAYSCNLYFLSLGNALGPDTTYRGLEGLGFGRTTGINLPGETAGRLSPPPDDMSRRYLIGDTDAVTATPLQMITYLSALVNGGSVWVPAVTSTPGEIKAFRPKLARKVEVSRAAPVIMKGMRDAVVYGTASGAAVEGHDIAGKTGTGSFPGAPWDTHAWFLGFAPAENPRVAVLVFLYRGRGGPDAAPAGARVLAAYLDVEPGP